MSIEIDTLAQILSGTISGPKQYVSASYELANKSDLSASLAKAGVWNISSSGIYYNASNVGIGKNNPSKTLDINGDIHVNGSIFQNNNLTTKNAYNFQE